MFGPRNILAILDVHTSGRVSLQDFQRDGLPAHEARLCESQGVQVNYPSTCLFKGKHLNDRVGEIRVQISCSKAYCGLLHVHSCHSSSLKHLWNTTHNYSLVPRPIRLQNNARSPLRPGIDCIWVWLQSREYLLLYRVAPAQY